MKIIQGEMGGKGGKGQRAPIEANDTLRATQTIKLLFAVSEGEIEEVEDVLLNKVSISNFDAEWDWRPGTANQSKIPGFINTESPLAPFTPAQLLAGVNNDSSIEHDVDAVRLIFSLDALRQVLTNGDIVGYGVSIQVWTRPSTAANWTLNRTVTKRGKASSPYAWDVEIPRPEGVTDASPWEIRLVRQTADDGNLKRSSVTRIINIIAIRYTENTYPNTALIGIIVRNADQFGGEVGDVRFKVRGTKVKIPNNYNPETRTYSGTWDLGMTDLISHYTDNPAWHIYHILTNARKGLDIPADEIDRVSFYQLSQYADQLVDNGRGGTEPRYTIHNQYYTRENAHSFLAQMLSVCNASFSNNAFGQIKIVFDKAGEQPTKLVTNANVIDGMFDYSSNALETRYSQANVTYNNKLSLGETDTATFSDNDLIDRYGLQTTDIVLPGCTSEAQAIRKARWAIYTNARTTDLISFRVFLAGMVYSIGEIVKVMDSDNAGPVQHGLVKSYAHASGSGTLVLDRQLTLEAGPYTLSYLGADGYSVFDVSIIQSNVTTDTITFNGADNPAYIGGAFILAGAIVPRLFRVVGISKSDEYYSISGLIYDTNKFSYIDSGVVLDSPTGDFVNVTEFTTAAIQNLAAEENSSSDGVNSSIQLLVTWDWNLTGASKFQADYIATWRRDSQEFQTIRDISGKGFTIENAVPGTYEITVWAINPLTGIKSSPVSLVKQYRTEAGTSTLEPPVNIRVTGTAGLTFDTPALSLSFDYNPANEDKTDALLDYVVELWDTAVLTRYGTFTIEPVGKNGNFQLPFVENIALFGQPTRQFVVKVFSRDLTGYLSTAGQVTVSNPVPGVASFNLANAIGSAFIRITPPSGNDIAGYKVWRSTSASFTKDASTERYDGPDTYINIAGEETQLYYYAVAAYDTFGKTDLNISGEQSGQTLGVNVDTWSLSDIKFTVNTPVANRIYWTAGTILRNATQSYSILAGNADHTTGTLYVYFRPLISETVLQTSTTLADAVAPGSYPLATYTGGGVSNLKGGDGSAFISGSQVIAGSVGASQLVAGSAVITGSAQIDTAIINEGHLQNAIIGNAQIKDVIQSTNYNAVNKTGWRISKPDNTFTMFDGNIELVGAGKFSIKSATTGQRMEQTTERLQVFDSNGTLRVKLGKLT